MPIAATQEPGHAAPPQERPGWRARRVVLIGQAPGPTGPPPGRPLVGGRTGRMMQRITGCEKLKDYIRFFETMNVLDRYPGRNPSGKGDRFPADEARLAAIAKLPRLAGRTVVFCGLKVAEAFGFPAPLYEMNVFIGRVDKMPILFSASVIPHPSPIVTYWNDPANLARAQEFFRTLLGPRRAEWGMA